MSYFLSFTPSVKQSLQELKNSAHLEKRFKAVSKALKYFAEDPRHPSLQTHQYFSLFSSAGDKVFEAYAEQDTPVAYRIFSYSCPRRGEIVVFAITPHP